MKVVTFAMLKSLCVCRCNTVEKRLGGAIMRECLCFLIYVNGFFGFGT